MNTKHKAGDKIVVMIPSHTTITIRRPSGAVEEVRLPAPYCQLTDSQFASIRNNTKAAGRGDALSYTNHDRESVYTFTAADEATQSTESIEQMMAYGE